MDFCFHVALGDFSTSFECMRKFIFLLTSFFINSIHSISCNKSPLQISMKNGRENRTMATKKKAAKKKKKH
jgi:hypothetical protein